MVLGMDPEELDRMKFPRDRDADRPADRSSGPGQARRLDAGATAGRADHGGEWPDRRRRLLGHDVGSSEELHERTALCPIGSYLSFEIRPLIYLDTSFAMGRYQLPA
jgi:hypothetical protein